MEPPMSKAGYRRAKLCVLGAVNAGTFAAAVNLVLTLDPEDRISVKRGCALTALGFVYFMSLFELFTFAALFTTSGSRLRHKYRLNCGDVLDINNKLVSAVQAGLSCVTGAVVCLWSCTRDFMRSSHFMSEAYAWFGAAYFFYDIWSMYLVHVRQMGFSKTKSSNDKVKSSNEPKNVEESDSLTTISEEVGCMGPKKPKRGPKCAACGDCLGEGVNIISFFSYCRHEPVILFHHLFIGGFGFLVIVYLRGGLGDCVFGFVYLMELSTPFVSLRGILSRLGLKSSRAYLLNGLAMLATFFVCRVLSLPYVCFMYSRVIGLPYFEAIKSLPTGCKISICILLLPQLYWFYLMSAGAVKVFVGAARARAVAGAGAQTGAGARGQIAMAGAGAKSGAPLAAGDNHKRS
ncbi:PREDICTED: protein FAM57A [Papilio polytes]|uniref:protein FAM57A n=1 Tax=Papilio polytes TaxID=76194 RepID=UPI00067609B3|nr:PREDICTED: protein FAM57A [Papilio polytes]